MVADEPAVKVTLPKIYDKLLDVERKVDPIPAIVADHESRLRILEIAQAKGAPRAPWWAVFALALTGGAILTQVILALA